MSSATDNTLPSANPAWERLGRPFWFVCYYLGLLGYGLGVLAVFVISVPASWRCPAQGRRWFRSLCGGIHRVFVGCLRATGGLRLRFEPAETRITPGTILVANHPGLLDFPILTCLDPGLICFHKQALARTPLRPALRACGHLSNREGIDSIHRAIAALKAGENVAVFPEGTRSPPHGPGPFQPAFALLAAKSGASVQPVALLASSRFLGRHGRWWLPPALPIRITVRSGPVFRLEPGETSARLTVRVEAWFHDTLNRQVVS